MGHYQDREFGGLIMFLRNAEGTELNGMWLGVGNSSQRVKAGKWVLSHNKASDEYLARKAHAEVR
ncbi:MAG TPA: hypothetical protein VMB52_00335 [Verrucomicrobiae bacterium]|nr:hypothetical protein [Verrucomicrobiae bacterium]